MKLTWEVLWVSMAMPLKLTLLIDELSIFPDIEEYETVAS